MDFNIFLSRDDMKGLRWGVLIRVTHCCCSSVLAFSKNASLNAYPPTWEIIAKAEIGTIKKKIIFPM